MGCAVTTIGVLTVVTLLLGAARLATTAGPLGTWYDVPIALWATKGVAESAICVGLTKLLALWDWEALLLVIMPVIWVLLESDQNYSVNIRYFKIT